jgi:energy-coupling factor transport system permease protein
MLDARAWLLWALTVLVTASSARNPFYVVLLLMVTVVVIVACAPAQGRQAPLSPLRFAAVAVPLSALFNGLTVHVGDTVFFRLPEWIPLLGGPVTLEALVFGATNGLTLTAIFSGFAVVNQVTPVRDLVRLTPRAFHEAGVVLSIALTFIPQTTRSLSRIREAQAVRGHRVRGLRDWLPIVVPLLVSGLERSMGLAEAMVARGYGSVSERAQPLRTQGLLVLGLLALLGGWLAFLFLPSWRGVATGVMVLGAALIVGIVWLAGRSVRHTTYRERRWAARDTLAVLGCGVTLAVVTLPLPLMDQGTLYYSPYPRVTLPVFDPFIGLGLLGLLVPAAMTTGVRADHVQFLRSEKEDWGDQNSGQGQA